MSKDRDMMPTPHHILKIDAEACTEKIAADIRETVRANSARAVVIGLSGGLDSAVLAALAVMAVGRENVEAYYIYDRHSANRSYICAKMVADRLGIRFHRCDITAQMRELGIYSPLVMRLTSVSAAINGWLSTCMNRWPGRQSPFIWTLRRGCFEHNGLASFFYKHTVSHVEAAFNARHIFRRRFLQEKAREKNALVLGAANKSEWMVGWFVRGGIDDLPLSPLKKLYKSQVLQLAEYLDVPLEVRGMPPSPDMLKGLSDESALGISYDALDAILYYIERGESDERIISKGFDEEDVLHVRTMYELSDWKRSSEDNITDCCPKLSTMNCQPCYD